MIPTLYELFRHQSDFFGKIIKEGVLADIPSIHRMTIDGRRDREVYYA